MYTFKPEYLFTKGIVNAEFFDPATDELLGFSEYVTDFAIKGKVNTGEVSGGPGNMLVMCIPDTARLSITARTADSALNNMALASGGTVTPTGVIEVVKPITATTADLEIPDAAVPPSGNNGRVCYILNSDSPGTPYKIFAGVVDEFDADPGKTYFVRYFTRQTAGETMTVPALFTPRVVRAHFAVNCYAKTAGRDVMASALYKIRHYFIPCYYFTGALNDTLSQTATGSVDLSGLCMTHTDADGKQIYGYVVDELVDNS